MKTFIFVACSAIIMSGCTMGLGKDNGIEYSINSVSDKKVKKEFEVGYFTNLNIIGSLDIIFKQPASGNPKVRIEGARSFVERISVKNRGKSLDLKLMDSKGLNFWRDDDAKVYIYAPDLTGINITGSGDFKASQTIDTDRLKISITGSGDLDMANLVCDDADVRVTGSGHVKVKNASCNNMNINITGSGDVEIKFVNSGDVMCRATGCGDIELKGTVKSLKQKCSPMADVQTHGLRIVK